MWKKKNQDVSLEAKAKFIYAMKFQNIAHECESWDSEENLIGGKRKRGRPQSEMDGLHQGNHRFESGSVDQGGK